jgi:glycosyltransferase involved in cell wall biosynthesis
MLSVLIPVFRYDVRDLVRELHRQCLQLEIPFEIRLLDDGSGESFCRINSEISELEHVVWEESLVNTGRSKVRNDLSEKAKYDWFWFLDCDGDARVNPELASTFWNARKEDTLISGGRVYQVVAPENERLYLHWLWGSQRELLDPEIRMKDPVTSFLSNNFIIHRTLLEKIPFDTQLVGYGYEDTLFAAELINAGYKIQHIKNPVLHAGLENSKDFLNKIEESLDNLFRLKELCAEKGISFPVRSKLMLLFRLIHFPLFRPFFAKWFIRNQPHWRNQLLGRKPHLRIFDLYRLAYMLNQ